MSSFGRQTAIEANPPSFAFRDRLDGIKSYRLIGEADMRTTQQISVTLPKEMAARVKAKVASGEYASESEVIREGLRALQARDRAMEDWLRRDVLPIYDSMKRDPARGRSVEHVRAALAAADDVAAKSA